MNATFHEEAAALNEAEPDQTRRIPLSDFISKFGSGLLQAVRKQNPPIFDDLERADWDVIIDSLLRTPFPAQRRVVHAITTLLTQHSPAGIINAEMGTGKTLMGILVATLLHHAGLPRTLVLAPPHLVYKWRREIRATVPGAQVWILNGPDTLRKLLQLRTMRDRPTSPQFFILGRVRMRMGFDWRPAFATRPVLFDSELGRVCRSAACCPRCGQFVCNEDGVPLTPALATSALNERRGACNCGERLWTLIPKRATPTTYRDMVKKALVQMPTVGPRTADNLLTRFGEDMLGDMLQDNVYEFINLMDEEGDLVFSDRQAKRMERALAYTEVSFGQGGFQPTEFIKRVRREVA
ncbi:SNF2-related protein [Achromobacter sp. PD1]|uniref:SNF2-related protein n=1 Tax=Achromobacter sp. PD1 TaxID=3399125 RepID=UPI003AF5AB2E